MKTAFFLALCAFGVPTIANAACQQRPLPYDEPAQRVDQGVQRLAHRSGCFVKVDLPQYGKRRTAPIKGVFTPRDALVRMVRPAGLVVASGPQGSGFRLASFTQAGRRGATPRPSPAAGGQSDVRIQELAARIDRKIDAAVSSSRISSERAAELHQQVGQVQAEAGHAGRTQSALSAEQAAAFQATLSGIEDTVTQR